MASHVLRPNPPVRAFLIGDGALLGGVVLAIWGQMLHWPIVVLVIWWIVAALGVLLVGAAVVSMYRNRVHVDIDDDGYRLTGPGLDRQGRWSEVSRVTQNSDGTRLTFHHGEVARTHLLVPGGVQTPQMRAVVADVASHLDSDRGYQDFSGV